MTRAGTDTVGAGGEPTGGLAAAGGAGRDPAGELATAGIDELLRYEEPAEPVRRSRVGTAVKSLLLVAVGTAAALFGLRVFGTTAPVTLVATAAAALVALWHLVRAVAPSAGVPGGGVSRSRGRRSEPDGGDAAYYRPVPDGMRRSVVSWERHLARHAESPASFARHLRPRLRDVVDERLRQAYGVTIGTEPERARAVLGEPLWGMLTGAGDHAPSRRELAQAVSRLEELYVTPTAEGAVRD